MLAVCEAGVTFAALRNFVSAYLELVDALRGEVGIIAVTHFQDFVEAQQDPLVYGMQSHVEEVRCQGAALCDSLGSLDVMHRVSQGGERGLRMHRVSQPTLATTSPLNAQRWPQRHRQRGWSCPVAKFSRASEEAP